MAIKNKLPDCLLVAVCVYLSEQTSLARQSEKMAAMKQEMMMEKQRLASIEQQCALRTEEINSLHARMQQTHEQHNNEVRVLKQTRELHDSVFLKYKFSCHTCIVAIAVT